MQVHTSIDSISEVWALFHASSPHLNPAYLAALEKARPIDMGFRYLVIRKGDSVAACAYMQLVTYSGQNFSDQGPAPLLFFLRIFFRLKKVRLLFCGNLFSVDFPCLHIKEDLISLDQALKALLSYVKIEKCQLFMLKELALKPEQVQVASRNGFRSYGEDMTMALTINDAWRTFDDYHQSLSKKYRKRLRMIRQAKDPFSVRRLSEEEINARLPEIGNLFRQTASRQFLKMGIVDGKYFTAMKDALGDKFFMHGYFLGNHMVAFSSYIDHNGMLELHYIGIDYDYNEQYRLYFNILYDGVALAIKSRKKILELGRTAREAKASVGCVPMPSYDYLFVSNSFVNFLIAVFEKLFLSKMGAGWKNRNPFMTAAKAELINQTA